MARSRPIVHDGVMKSLMTLALLGAAPAAAAPLDEVAATLAATRTMTADFVQTAPDGRQARGRMILARPGRIRFDYDSSKLLVVADGRRLSMVDYGVGQVSQWPINATPLAALLDPAKDLGRVARIVGDTPAALQVEARDPKHPAYGAITLNFSRTATGLALTGWTARDAQQGSTEVVLSNVRSNVAVDLERFTFRDPRTRAPGRPG